MGTEDKAGNMADKLKGKVKEAAGKAVGNERLQAEGKGDQVKGDAKQAVEKAKEALKD
ncbi:CsbD family protein [Streptacidiphilus sp. N1-10]|uniref:CsbD family protein n=1 Tax=Streptacidiphilus jeojiensis TaxID=3229225 RepID=A0ABV6XG07_9ACTN